MGIHGKLSSSYSYPGDFPWFVGLSWVSFPEYKIIIKLDDMTNIWPFLTYSEGKGNKNSFLLCMLQ